MATRISRIQTKTSRGSAFRCLHFSNNEGPQSALAKVIRSDLAGHEWDMGRQKTAYSRKPLILLLPEIGVELRITKAKTSVVFSSSILFVTGMNWPNLMK